MSSHFSANQYETAFSSQRLQNYQLPAKHKQHPSLRSGSTKVITNDRGHLVGDVKRSVASPWGSFVGTWQMERKAIQLKTTTKLLTHYTSNSGHSSRVSSVLSDHSNRETTSRASNNKEKDTETKSPENDVTKSPPGSAASRATSAKSTSGSNPASRSGSVQEQASSVPSTASVSGSRPASSYTQGSGRSKTSSTMVSSSRVHSAQAGSRVKSAVTSPFEVILLPQSAGSVRSASVASSIPVFPEGDQASRSVTPSQALPRPDSRMGSVTGSQSPLAGGSRMSTSQSECASSVQPTPLMEARLTSQQGSVTPTSNPA